MTETATKLKESCEKCLISDAEIVVMFVNGRILKICNDCKDSTDWKRPRSWQVKKMVDIDDYEEELRKMLRKRERLRKERLKCQE